MVSPTKRSPRVGIAPAYAGRSRASRRPQHRFNIRFKPYQLQPFMIAPVLPGESLKTLMLQTQVWSSPLVAMPMRNIGWWLEYFFFYVKHRDLSYGPADTGLGNALVNAFVTGGDLTAFQDANGNVSTYCPPGGVDFVLEATKRIAEEYFRDEGEPWDEAKVGDLPAVKIYGKGGSDWSEKLTLVSDYEDRRVPLDVDQDGGVTVDEVERAYIEWAAMKDAGLMDMDYEDWMRTYGSTSVLPNDVRPDYHRPEDLAHYREFTYPTNTVEPTTGLPSTAVGWRSALRNNKAYFFKEPGWIVGLCVARPKVYLGFQKSNVASMMQTREAWLPAILNDQLNVSHMLVDKDIGPLAGVPAEDYYVDLRDLLNYGDQFINYAPADAAPFVMLPEAAGNRRYPVAGDIEKWFVALEGVYKGFDMDGVCSLSILGRQQERTNNLVLGKA